jgi:hypothetical protein
MVTKDHLQRYHKTRLQKSTAMTNEAIKPSRQTGNP